MWGYEPTSASATEFEAWYKSNFTRMINSWQPKTVDPMKTN
jgi:hypothetical protein